VLNCIVYCYLNSWDLMNRVIRLLFMDLSNKNRTRDVKSVIGSSVVEPHHSAPTLLYAELTFETKGCFL
jgi:hypothetical protein